MNLQMNLLILNVLDLELHLFFFPLLTPSKMNIAQFVPFFIELLPFWKRYVLSSWICNEFVSVSWQAFAIMLNLVAVSKHKFALNSRVDNMVEATTN